MTVQKLVEIDRQTLPTHTKCFDVTETKNWMFHSSSKAESVDGDKNINRYIYRAAQYTIYKRVWSMLARWRPVYILKGR